MTLQESIARALYAQHNKNETYTINKIESDTYIYDALYEDVKSIYMNMAQRVIDRAN